MAGAAFAIVYSSFISPILLNKNTEYMAGGVSPQSLEEIVNASYYKSVASEVVSPEVLDIAKEKLEVLKASDGGYSDEQTGDEVLKSGIVGENVGARDDIEIGNDVTKSIAITDNIKDDDEKTSGAIVTKNAYTRYPRSLEINVKKGDTLTDLLTEAGVPFDETNNIFGSIKKVFNPRELNVGDSFTLEIDRDASNEVVVKSLEMPVSNVSTVRLERQNDDSFSVQKIKAKLTKKLARAGGEINSSIYQTAAEFGIPMSTLSQVVNAYSYNVDFQRDVKKGDSIDVLFELTENKDGEVIENKGFVFSELNLGNRSLKIYRYTDKDGNTNFYDENGESVRKGLLKTPVNGARITSRYGLRRHPIAGYTKMHRGVDFGAPKGTPVYASGDGVVKQASRNGGYGNYLKIQHNSKYASAYAHLSRYAKGIAPGKRVKQGQIVAYVGTTGRSTGPHLHYEILVNGKQVNPSKVKFKGGEILRGRELAAFRRNVAKIDAQLASIKIGGAVTLADASK